MTRTGHAGGLDHSGDKATLAPLRSALYHGADATTLRSVASAVFAPDAVVQLAFPFEDLDGSDGWCGDAIGVLRAAMPDLERRDTIVIAGPDPDGSPWVGCCGHYQGTWTSPLLGLPASGEIASMRFHEFYRFDAGRVVEVQALWDLPELMLQTGVWPMGPSLGRWMHAPGPATQDGLVDRARQAERSARSARHVVEMLGDMGKHPSDPDPAVMRLEHWWHPSFNWYGPAGIGTSRGIDGFRRHHQIPFLEAMPDRRGGYRGDAHFFGDGDYVGVTAWPGMAMTLTGSNWLGIPATGAELTMRSLDFWRVEDDAEGRPRIRENWVLVDLLDVWNQLGVDVLDRARQLGRQRR